VSRAIQSKAKPEKTHLESTCRIGLQHLSHVSHKTTNATPDLASFDYKTLGGAHLCCRYITSNVVRPGLPSLQPPEFSRKKLQPATTLENRQLLVLPWWKFENQQGPESGEENNLGRPKFVLSPYVRTFLMLTMRMKGGKGFIYKRLYNCNCELILQPSASSMVLLSPVGSQSRQQPTTRPQALPVGSSHCCSPPSLQKEYLPSRMDEVKNMAGPSLGARRV
jgi:hypothetical protein